MPQTAANSAVTRSSGMKIDPDLRGQARVLAILKRTGATEYLNALGGRHLYEPAAFDEEDLHTSGEGEWATRYT